MQIELLLYCTSFRSNNRWNEAQIRTDKETEIPSTFRQGIRKHDDATTATARIEKQTASHHGTAEHRQDQDQTRKTRKDQSRKTVTGTTRPDTSRNQTTVKKPPEPNPKPKTTVTKDSQPPFAAVDATERTATAPPGRPTANGTHTSGRSPPHQEKQPARTPPPEDHQSIMLNALTRSSFHPPQLTKRGQQSIRISSTHTEEHPLSHFQNEEERDQKRV